MDSASDRNRTNYWPGQTLIPSRSHKKLNINALLVPQYRSNVEYPVNSNSLKRTLSGRDPQAPPLKKRSSVLQATPMNQSDDDDDSNSNHTCSSTKTNGSKRDDNSRRAAHTAAEQKRRNAIRKGYDALQALVPNSHLLDPVTSQKVSKAAILKRSIDFLSVLNEETKQIEEELNAKTNETFCLRTVQRTYEEILEANLKSSKKLNASINDEQKFQLFQRIADELFSSFDQAMQTSKVLGLSQFTSGILRWIEDSCRPSDLNEIVRHSIGNSKS